MTPIPAGAKPANYVAGIGWRSEHYRALLEERPPVGFLEVHSENFFGDGGQPHHYLERAREYYPLSLHGVGLSLGSSDAFNETHLAALDRLVRRYQPFLVSEHLCWSSVGGRYLNELLPLPYTEEALAHLCGRVDHVQARLRRRILVENIAAYVRFRHSTIPEAEFLAELSKRTGCGLLLDVNNVYVNAINHGFDATGYIDAVNADSVEEIHLAGFDESGDCLIDTHGRLVQEPVWDLYRYAIRRLGARPTLIEWDTDIPPIATLVAQAHHADRMQKNAHALAD
ncbi:MAG: DUF692 domain-containing protein [Burkholderiales bacterium]